MLRLLAFGGLRLEGPDGLITGPAARRRPLAVLAVIAAAGARGVTRDRIVGIFWPEGTEEQGRHALAQVLYALRRELGVPDLFAPGPTLRLNPEVFASDIADFIAALARGDRAAAIGLYAGPLLDGFYLSQAPDFERWVEEERAQFAAQYRRALEQDAAALAASGAHSQAAERWGAVVALDPLATGPRLRLMQALRAASEPAAALEEARAHAELLRQELDSGPAPEIAALERELRSAAAVAPTPASLPRVPSVQPHAPPVQLRRKRVVPAAAVALLSVAAFAALLWSQRAPDPPVVAVGVVESHLPQDSLGIARSLGDLLATQLVQVPRLRVVGRARILEVLGSETAAGPGVLSRAARTAGAGELIEGVLYPDPAGLRLDLRSTGLVDGQVHQAVSMTARDPVSLVEGAVAALAERWKLPPPAAPLRSITSVSLLARRFYDQALRTYYAGEPRAATGLFRIALAEDSTFAMAAYYLARSMSDAQAESAGGRWRTAVRLAERATDRERLLILASGGLALDDARGLAFAETLAVRYPHDLDGIRLLGELRFTRGDFAAAVDAFEQVIALDSAGRRGQSARCHACDAGESAVWASLMGDSLERAGRIAAAMRQWPPATVRGASLLSTVLLRQGRAREALEAARAGAALGPGIVPEGTALEALQRAGEMPRLDSVLSRQLEVARFSEQRPGLLERLIGVRREGGRPRSALALAEEYDRLHSPAVRRTAPFAHLQRVLTLLELGRSNPSHALAARALFDSMAQMPGYDEPRMARHRAWMWTHVATAAAEAGDTGALGELSNRIAAMAQRSAYGRDRRLHWYVIGLLREARGDWEQARIAYAAALWSPTDNHVAPRLARAALETGRPQDAIRALAPYLRGPLDASNQYLPRWRVHRLMGDAWRAAGFPDSARAHDAWVRRALANAEPEYRRFAMRD